jgi:hypothetical protein
VSKSGHREGPNHSTLTSKCTPEERKAVDTEALRQGVSMGALVHALVAEAIATGKWPTVQHD